MPPEDAKKLPDRAERQRVIERLDGVAAVLERLCNSQLIESNGVARMLACIRTNGRAKVSRKPV